MASRMILGAIALVSLGVLTPLACGGPEPLDSAEDGPVAQAPQAVTGACGPGHFQAPCDPDGAGPLSECEGICLLDMSRTMACLKITDVGIPNLNGRVCGSPNSTDCTHSCQNGACAVQPASNGTACQA